MIGHSGCARMHKAFSRTPQPGAMRISLIRASDLKFRTVRTHAWRIHFPIEPSFDGELLHFTMDPLSVSAAIVGLLSAGAAVTSLVRNVKNASKLAKGVLLEVNTITTCLTALQRFVNGSVLPARSRTALVMIDELRVVLIECVITFSDLKETLVKLGTTGKKGPMSRLKWASREQPISSLLLRLQGSRISLTLMLTTFNWYVKCLSW